MPGTKALYRAMPEKLSTDHQCCAFFYFPLLSDSVADYDFRYNGFASAK